MVARVLRLRACESSFLENRALPLVMNGSCSPSRAERLVRSKPPMLDARAPPGVGDADNARALEGREAGDGDPFPSTLIPPTAMLCRRDARDPGLGSPRSRRRRSHSAFSHHNFSHFSLSKYASFNFYLFAGSQNATISSMNFALLISASLISFFKRFFAPHSPDKLLLQLIMSLTTARWFSIRRSLRLTCH